MKPEFWHRVEEMFQRAVKLDESQRAGCVRAHESDAFQAPIPTRMISNGEYMPVPQTTQQKQVEHRIQELSDTASRKLGIDRRRFLASTGGMAAALLAMNEVFGRFFDVDPIEMLSPLRTHRRARLGTCSSSTINCTWCAGRRAQPARRSVRCRRDRRPGVRAIR